MMRTSLLFAVLCMGITAGLKSQDHRTPQCTDKCVFGYQSILYFCDLMNDCVPDSGKTVALLRNGEFISTDTTHGDGHFTLIIPELEIRENHLTYFAMVTRRWRMCGMAGSSEPDTLVWNNEALFYPLDFVRCLAHHHKNEETLPVQQHTPQKITVDVFPVPATDVINLRFSEPFSGTVTLISMTGAVVFQAELHGEKERTLPIRHLPGIYTLQVLDLHGVPVDTRKVVITR